MPLQQIVPTWTAWNNANFTSPTALTDLRTGQPFAAGGLNLGDYFDATEQEAQMASYTTNGLLHSGRYRYVQVASNATANNVKTGTVGFLQPGTFVQNVVPLVAGTGMTAGTYIVTTAGGGGTVQATVQITVLTATTIATPIVLTPGYGFTSAPTVTLTGTGGTPTTFAAQLNTTMNQVTSFDIATTNSTLVRPVVFLNSITPGNYGFVQELGVATVLANSSLTSATANAWVNVKTSGAGTVDTLASSGSPLGVTIGQAIDLPYASILFKVLLGIACTVVQD